MNMDFRNILVAGPIKAGDVPYSIGSDGNSSNICGRQTQQEFDLFANDGECFSGGIGNVRDNPPAVCTVDDLAAAAGETTTDEVLKESDTVLPGTGDDFDAAVLISCHHRRQRCGCGGAYHRFVGHGDRQQYRSSRKRCRVPP